MTPDLSGQVVAGVDVTAEAARAAIEGLAGTPAVAIIESCRHTSTST